MASTFRPICRCSQFMWRCISLCQWWSPVASRLLLRCTRAGRLKRGRCETSNSMHATILLKPLWPEDCPKFWQSRQPTRARQPNSQSRIRTNLRHLRLSLRTQQEGYASTAIKCQSHLLTRKWLTRVALAAKPARAIVNSRSEYMHWMRKRIWADTIAWMTRRMGGNRKLRPRMFSSTTWRLPKGYLKRIIRSTKITIVVHLKPSLRNLKKIPQLKETKHKSARKSEGAAVTCLRKVLVEERQKWVRKLSWCKKIRIRKDLEEMKLLCQARREAWTSKKE